MTYEIPKAGYWRETITIGDKTEDRTRIREMLPDGSPGRYLDDDPTEPVARRQP